MRQACLVIVAVASIVLGSFSSAADAPAPNKLEVHEWGVLSAYQDVELANADMRGEWAGLPKFVHGQIDKRTVPVDVRLVNAPVIYFHAAQALNLTVRVNFPKGKPAVWWPSTVETGAQPLRSLVWRVQLKAPNADKLSPLPLPKGHWMESLRAVQADDVLITQPNREKERFLYYDGLVPTAKTTTIAVARDNVGIKNLAKYPLHDVTVVDLRNFRKIRVARLDKLDAGAEVKQVSFTEADQTKWPFDGIATLVKQLHAAGLFEDEAKALANVWRKGFFETEGVNVFYRLPQEVYDQLLPITLSAKPDKLVRVMLVHHPHCEPDLGELVMKLVQQLGSQNQEERIEAHKRLQKLGRAAFVHLLRARNAKPTPEVRMRLDKLLEEFEAEAGLQK
jgi:hypothetical protein